MDLIQLVSHALVMHLGMLVFFGRKVLASHVYGSKGEPSITDYWKKHRTTTLITVASAYALFMAALQFDQLNYLAAFGIGFAADSLGDAAAGAARKKLEGAP